MNPRKKIVLIGQMNVGKSTLFNRLIEKEKAIVSSVPGTTRDLNKGVCFWQGKEFTIIDTGGIVDKKTKIELKKETKQQINKALEQADLIFFLVKARPSEESAQGIPISNFEREISRLIKKEKNPCFLILNHADSPLKRSWAEDLSWLKLGFGQPWPISAVNGTGVGVLLDETIKFFNFKPQELEAQPPKETTVLSPLKISIIGRPNVGKSTLLNILLGEEKVIVSSQPHTTRGPQDTLIYYQEQPFLLIDTAGIRKKRKIKSILEKTGVKKSLDMIEKSDLVLMVLDATENISHQDKALLQFIKKQKRALLILLNKIDLVKEPSDIDLMPWAPQLFISAKNKQNTEKILPLVKKIIKNQNQWIKKEKLTALLKNIIIEKHWSEKIWRNAELNQIKTNPPQFILKIPSLAIKRKQVNPAQINIIKKEMRKKWSFKGCLIEIKIKSL